jgi:hypothetical protein
MTIAVSGFQRGSRIAMPAGVSGGYVEYFVPSLLAGLQVSGDGTLNDASVPADFSLHIPGPWMLNAGRRHGHGEAVYVEAAEADRQALVRLSRQPVTREAMMESAALLLGKPIARVFRDAIAWVNGASPGSAKLLPPPSSALEGLIRDLAVFIARTDIPAWVRQAISYYQLVHIHPFADGNGRYSRVLVAALGGHGASRRIRALLVATALTLHRKTFLPWFDAVQNGSLTRYLACWELLERWSGEYARQLVLQEDALRTDLVEVVRSVPLGNSLLSALAASPAIDVRHLAERFKWSAKTAPLHVKRLRDGGWLRLFESRPGLEICPPIAETRCRLLEDIRSQTLALLQPPSQSPGTAL